MELSFFLPLFSVEKTFMTDEYWEWNGRCEKGTDDASLFLSAACNVIVVMVFLQDAFFLLLLLFFFAGAANRQVKRKKKKRFPFSTFAVNEQRAKVFLLVPLCNPISGNKSPKS